MLTTRLPTRRTTAAALAAVLLVGGLAGCTAGEDAPAAAPGDRPSAGAPEQQGGGRTFDTTWDVAPARLTKAAHQQLGEARATAAAGAAEAVVQRWGVDPALLALRGGPRVGDVAGLEESLTPAAWTRWTEALEAADRDPRARRTVEALTYLADSPGMRPVATGPVVILPAIRSVRVTAAGGRPVVRLDVLVVLRTADRRGRTARVALPRVTTLTMAEGEGRWLVDDWSTHGGRVLADPPRGA